MKTIIAAIVGLLLFAGPASAVILTTNTASGTFDPSAGGGNFSISYNPVNANSVVVAGFYFDGGNGAATALTYGGNSPGAFLSEARTSLAYFLNPSTGGGLTLDGTSGNAAVVDAGYFIWELSGVDLAASVPSVIGIDGTTQITTIAADSFIADALGFNPTGGAAVIAPDANSVLATRAIVDANGASGTGGWLATGDVSPATAGTYELGWSITGPGFADYREMAFAFTPLPGGPVSWTFNGGGNWSDGTKWSGGSPPSSPGGEAVLGSALTAPNAPADISLDVAVDVSRIIFNTGNRYNITGPQTLTLSGDAEFNVGSGTHGISASIVGSSGLNKIGDGNLVLSGANTYSGTASVQAGSLQLASSGAVPGAVNVGAAGELAFVAGYNGTFAGDISGAGGVLLDNSLTAETVTFSGAKSLSGAIEINGGTLAISNAGALGTGNGTPATQTRVNEFGGLGTGKLALSGNINVANELLILGPRRGDGIANLVHLTSAGNNTWGGNIQGDANGDNYNFESTSNTLTLSGTISAPDGDGGVRNFVFSGAGNFNVSDITDFSTDANGAVGVGSVNTETNVFVRKQGSGTLTISTASNQQDDFWQGGTVIEGGTVEVISDGSSNGELWGPIEVQSGATLDVDHFGTYSLQVGQSVSGGGTIRATGKTVAIFDDNSISPGDSVGTLTINGNATLGVGDGGGVLAFELGDDPLTVGGTENDLININGALTTSGAPSMTVSVTAAEGEVVEGKYRLISHAGGVVTVSGMSAQFLDELGNPLTARQTLAVSSAAGQVNLDVTGSAANLTWTGANSTAWDKNTTANWDDGGSEVFFDQDQVTFDDSAAVGLPGDFNSDGTVDAADYTRWRDLLGAGDETGLGGNGDGMNGVDQGDYTLWVNNFGATGAAGTTVDISGADVYPALATFHSDVGNTYTITGTNGFGGTTPINLTGDVRVVLNNTNTLQGNINISAGATLDIGTGGGATTVSGNISGAGTLVVGGGFVPFTTANSLTGPIVINGGSMVPSNSGAFGTTDSGTTINAGGTVRFNFVNLLVSEAFTFNGGSLAISGNDGSATTLTGAISVAAGGADFQADNNLGADALIINSNISGSASGPIIFSVGTGSTIAVAGNITNNGDITKTGVGVLALGATTTVAAPVVTVNGGTLDVTAKGTHTVGSGQTLAGASGTVLGNVAAASGATIRVGPVGLSQKIPAEYTDATYGEGGNTTFVGGGTLNPPAGVFSGNDEWSFRTFGNSATILQGAPLAPYPDTESVPVIVTTITGLNPNETYTVYTNFWDVSDATWPIFTGDAENNLTLYANPNDGFAGATDAEDPNSLFYPTPVLTSESNRTLWGAPLQITADGTGTIQVFIDDTGNGPNQRTWYDGITVVGENAIAVAETFTIDGDLTLAAGTILALDMGTPDQTDLLTITGNLAAGGTLDVTLDGTVPEPGLGDVFNLLDFATASGSFNTVNLPDLTAGLEWDESNLLVTGELSVVAAGSFAAAGVPEPASVVLLLLAATGFGLVRKTRNRMSQSR